MEREIHRMRIRLEGLKREQVQHSRAVSPVNCSGLKSCRVSTNGVRCAGTPCSGLRTRMGT